MGFSATFPFLPFFIRELGVTDLHQVELWSGILTSAPSISMAIVAPVWGWLADRRGRKLMVERATFGGAAILVIMAFAGNVQQLFILRIIQGLLTGTTAAFMALVAAVSPPTEAGFALGMMQMAVYVGNSLGPLIGGLVADHMGYRWTFGVTGIMLLAAGLLVLRFINERFTPASSQTAQPTLSSSITMMAHSLPIIGAMTVIGGFDLANTITLPTLPLFVESVLGSGAAFVNTNTGSIYGVRALSSALAAGLAGRLSDKIGYRRTLIISTLGTSLLLLGQALSPSYVALILTSFGAGIFIGGLLPSANAILAHATTPEQKGIVYGVSTSISAAGRALGPIAGAAVATAWGFRAPFFSAALIMLLLTFWAGYAVRALPRPSVPEP